jgi:hypothetical protein
MLPQDKKEALNKRVQEMIDAGADDATIQSAIDIVTKKYDVPGMSKEVPGMSKEVPDVPQVNPLESAYLSKDVQLPRVSSMEKQPGTPGYVNPSEQIPETYLPSTSGQMIKIPAYTANNKPLAYAMDILSGIGRNVAGSVKAVNDPTFSSNMKSAEGRQQIYDQIKKEIANPNGSNIAYNTLKSPGLIPSLAIPTLAAGFGVDALSTIMPEGSGISGFITNLAKQLGYGTANSAVNQLDKSSQGQGTSMPEFVKDALVNTAIGAIPQVAGMGSSAVGNALVDNAKKQTLKDIGYSLDDVTNDILNSKLRTQFPNNAEGQAAARAEYPTVSDILTEYNVKPGTKPEIIYGKFAKMRYNIDNNINKLLRASDNPNVNPENIKNINNLNINDDIIEPLVSDWNKNYQKTGKLINNKVNPLNADDANKVIEKLRTFGNDLTTPINGVDNPMTLTKLYNFRKQLNPTNQTEEVIFNAIKNKIDNRLMMNVTSNKTGSNINGNELNVALNHFDDIDKIKRIMDKGKIVENKYLDKMTNTDNPNLNNLKNIDFNKPASYLNIFPGQMTPGYKLGVGGQKLGNLMQMISPVAGNAEQRTK